jgi:predicted Rossmann fold flavoprotein
LTRSVIIIGGGAAGMMAAISAARHGAAVILLEKNEKCGKKLHITGKGRCNLTNATDIPGLIGATVQNGRFLHSAFNALDAAALMVLVEELSVPLKIERGRRVFPVSDKADDINRAFQGEMVRLGVDVRLNTTVLDISKSAETPHPSPHKFEVKTTRGTFSADALIIATGGLAYPATGSTGDGYRFARGMGHSIVPTFASLAPVLCADEWIASLEGLSLRNVGLSAQVGGKIIFSQMGEMLFTETGVSGPLALSASAFLADKYHAAPAMSIDLKPALDEKTLDARLVRELATSANKLLSSIMPRLVPARMAPVVLKLAQADGGVQANAVTKAARQAIVQTLKKIPLTPTAAAGYKEAVITRGGISTKEIIPKSMESKLVDGLYFAGECIDADALTGGFNLQIAFSTGYLAGKSAARA